MSVVNDKGKVRDGQDGERRIPIRLPSEDEYSRAKVPVRQIVFEDEPVDQEELQSKIAALDDSYDYLVVGGGLFGCTFACQARILRKKCLVIERKPQMGGMIACENVGGITVNKYGVHLFIMRDENVESFVRKRANWIPYGPDFVPEGGYNVLINNLLKGIPTITGISYQDLMKARPDLKGKVIYTGPIDEYFGYNHGHLKYSAYKIIMVEREQTLYQYKGIRYQKLGEDEWCKVVEYKHLWDEKSNKTVVDREILMERWQPGIPGVIPYRLQETKKNEQIAEIYRKAGEQEPNVIFAGGLGTGRYMDMNDTIASAVHLANDLDKQETKEKKRKKGEARRLVTD